MNFILWIGCCLIFSGVVLVCANIQHQIDEIKPDKGFNNLQISRSLSISVGTLEGFKSQDGETTKVLQVKDHDIKGAQDAK